MNAASQSSRMPFAAKDAAMGMVPYMQSGDAMPRRHAGTMPRSPIRPPDRLPKRRWMCALPKTDTAEPMSMPRSQKSKI